MQHKGERSWNDGLDDGIWEEKFACGFDLNKSHLDRLTFHAPLQIDLVELKK